MKRPKRRFTSIHGVFLFSMLYMYLIFATQGQIPIPDPRSVEGKDGHEATAPVRQSISACLLVKDDNHFLIEWLAYHYHALPLSFLIVAVDPTSRTSPRKILERYRGKINIQMWNDPDYMNEQEATEAKYYVKRFFESRKDRVSDQLVAHRARQRLFYYKCMKAFKAIGNTWVLMIDSDEFLTINARTVRALRPLELVPSSVASQGSILRFIQQELQRPDHNWTTPCIQIPRIRFGATDTNHTHQVPTPFNASHFQTLRWRTHASENQYWANKISKTMIDVSRVDSTDIVPVDSIHRPIRSICGHRRMHIRPNQQVLRISHYLGTWEQYIYRDDPRQGKERSLETYAKLANLTSETDDDIRPWLEGFVRTQGLDTVKNLLDGIGSLVDRTAR